VVLDGHAGRRKLGRCRSRLSPIPKTYAEGAGSSESNPAPPRPDPLRVWARIAPSFGYYGDYQHLSALGSIRNPAYLYTGVTSSTRTGPNGGRLEGGFQGYRGGAMQDVGYELPRITILGNSVNRGRARPEIGD